MSIVDSGVSTERRNCRVEEPLLDPGVLMMYKCQPAVVDQRSVLRVGVWRERPSNDALEAIRRHFLLSARVRASMPGLRNHQR